MSETQAQEAIDLLRLLLWEMRDIKRLVKAGEKRERGYETAEVRGSDGLYAWERDFAVMSGSYGYSVGERE